MNQTEQQPENAQSATFAITHSGMAIKISRRQGIWTIILAVLNSTRFINSICHLWGRQPHGTSDSSRDSWLVSLVTFGEGYHNYHHMYPTDYRNGPCWYHFDPSKWVIHGLYSLGLATSLRTGSYVENSLARTN